MAKYSQEELENIFDNHVEVTEHPTGEIFYLEFKYFNELRNKGVIRCDEEIPEQWSFNEEDIEEIEKVI